MIKNIWKAVKFYLTWKMLPIVGTMYLFTNAIWYVLAFTPHIPSWLAWVARGYLAFIWTPFGVEKVVIVVGAPIIYRWVYKEDFNKGERV